MKMKFGTKISTVSRLALLAALAFAFAPFVGVADAQPSALDPATGLPRPVSDGAQTTRRSTLPRIDPATGLPQAAQPGASSAGRSTALTINPATDLAQAMPAEDWKDPNWVEPGRVLGEVRYDGLPLGEVARNLRDQFTNAFDILLPSSWQNPGDPASAIDPQSVLINIELKNVTASEVFHAMNLVFEAQNTPVRWELRMNGNRPAALVRVLPALVPASGAPPPAPEESRRMVYFVGELLGDEKSGGMTMDQVYKMVSEVFQMSYGNVKGVLQYHKEAQLLVVTGTTDQLEFVGQTLEALKEKTQRARASQTKSLVPQAKTEAPGKQ